MRIRSTKPEFFRSRRVASVEWGHRYVLKALESYVDDNGVGKDDVALIASDCFPRDLTREPSRVLARVPEAINSLHEAGLLWRYEAEGEDLIFIAFWDSIQRIDRPSKGRLRRPDGTIDYRDSEIGAPNTSPREDDTKTREPSPLEQGNRGTGEQGTLVKPAADATDIDREFEDDFWSIYPRRVKKAEALKAFRKARKSASLETILDGVRRYTKTVAGKDSTYVSHPSSWLNGARWTDEDETTVAAADEDIPHYFRRSSGGES